MSTVAEIESAIERLQPSEVAEIAAWLDEYQQMIQASAEMFARVLAPNLSGQRQPLSERDQGNLRNELSDRMMGLRGACEDGDRRACVRLGIIIGENRERRAAWRREHPEVFFYER